MREGFSSSPNLEDNKVSEPDENVTAPKNLHFVKNITTSSVHVVVSIYFGLIYL